MFKDIYSKSPHVSYIHMSTARVDSRHHQHTTHYLGMNEQDIPKSLSRGVVAKRGGPMLGEPSVDEDWSQEASMPEHGSPSTLTGSEVHVVGSYVSANASDERSLMEAIQIEDERS